MRLVRSSYIPVLIALFATFSTSCSSSTAAPAVPPPPQVSVISVSPERVSLTRDWIATLDGFVNAQIRPQVSGYLVRRTFQEGAMVKKGQVLFEIDARPFAAAAEEARGRMSEAEAQLGKAQRDVARDRPLAEQRAIAQSQLDNDIQAELAASAALKSAQAAVSAAELNLGFTHVVSLIDGVAAIATAQIGDLVGPTTLLTTVSQIDPIKAYFPLSEQEYIEAAGSLNGARTGSLWGAAPLRLILADGSAYPETGTFLAADREIDPKTGTIRISATFPNRRQFLRPGQYGRVEAETRVLPDALLIPQRAVTELQGTYQVRTLDGSNKVTTRTVKVGPRVGSRWVIDEGLTRGATVVVEGPATRDGVVVSPRPFQIAENR